MPSTATPAPSVGRGSGRREVTEPDPSYGRQVTSLGFVSERLPSLSWGAGQRPLLSAG